MRQGSIRGTKKGRPVPGGLRVYQDEVLNSANTGSEARKRAQMPTLLDHFSPLLSACHWPEEYSRGQNVTFVVTDCKAKAFHNEKNIARVASLVERRKVILRPLDIGTGPGDPFGGPFSVEK